MKPSSGFQPRAISFDGSLRPRPIDARIELIDDRADLRLCSVGAVEERLAVQRAGQQQRGVDGGQLALAGARAGGHVEEVIEKALVARGAGGLRALRRVVKKAQRRQRAFACLLARDPAAGHTDRVAREREAHRCNAGHGRRGPAVGRQAGAGVGRFPEEAEAALLQIFQQPRRCQRRRALGNSRHARHADVHRRARGLLVRRVQRCQRQRACARRDNLAAGQARAGGR